MYIFEGIDMPECVLGTLDNYSKRAGTCISRYLLLLVTSKPRLHQPWRQLEPFRKQCGSEPSSA